MKKPVIPKLHVHPISAHFPSAFFPFAAVFLVLFVIKGDHVFDVGAKFALWSGVFTNPIAIASGFVDWKVKYKAARVPIFKKKIAYSIAAQVLAVICVIWHCMQPDVMAVNNFLSYIYFTIVITASLFTLLVGRWGARLVYM